VEEEKLGIWHHTYCVYLGRILQFEKWSRLCECNRMYVTLLDGQDSDETKFTQQILLVHAIKYMKGFRWLLRKF
jgi:hypothetical protein